MNLMTIILQQDQASPSPLTSLLPLLLIIVVFYFFMIRPQVKKQKELKNYRNAIQKGEKIVTTGGIYGKVMDIKDQTVTVEIADNVPISPESLRIAFLSWSSTFL
jgi:preprotein translocase subunit YajC